MRNDGLRRKEDHMKQVRFAVRSNTRIAKDVYEMTLDGDTSALTAPGQFVNIKIDGLFLRRPISVCRYGDGTMTLIYKVVGKGTERMKNRKAGDEADVLVGLGNGFDTAKSGESPLLIGEASEPRRCSDFVKNLCPRERT